METTTRLTELPGELRYIQYEHGLEEQYLPAIRALISKDLSEPYSIYVYRYFLYQWGHLCFLALDPVDSSLVGVIVCKLETHASHSPATLRGYIAMLAVSSAYRGHGIATTLVKRAIEAMAQRNADEIVLETEESNTPAMRLYERLGFLRSKKLHRYYLNGSSAYRSTSNRRGLKSSPMAREAPWRKDGCVVCGSKYLVLQDHPYMATGDTDSDRADAARRRGAVIH